MAEGAPSPLELTTPPKVSRVSSDEVYLTIRSQPPSHVFSREDFALEFALEVSKGSTNSPPTDVSIQAVLESSFATLQLPDLLEVLEEPRISASRKTGRLSCRIVSQGVISRQHGAAHKIKLSVKDHPAITPVTTDEICLVNAKIQLTTGEDWNNVWYKDEGGRDKSMEVNVGMYDQANRLLKEKVPLTLTLCYAAKSPLVVTNQDILRTLGSDRKLCIDKNTGNARVRFRIEDVSKNHQGQDFILEVAADIKLFKDVAPGYTPAVSVRSKRNKRQRSSLGSQQSGQTSATMPSESPAPPPPVQGQGPAFGETPRIMEGVDPETIREAIHGVSQWANEVVNGLYPLQWQVLGYAQLPDGSPDYTRPYHSMPNPNPLISRVLSIYSETTRSQLQLLEQSMSRTAAVSKTETVFSPLHPPPEHYGMPMPPGVAIPGRGGPIAMPPPHHPQPPPEAAYREYAYYGRPPPPAHRYEGAPDPMAMPPIRGVPRRTTGAVPAGVSAASSRKQQLVASPTDDDDEEDTRESEVEYVLAKQYKSLRTGERLGFPAYSASKEMLGFYREGANVGVGQFVPISQHADDFGSLSVRQQASSILQQALDTKSEAVHALRDWGTISNLLDHALVYEWSKDISGNNRDS